ncbi:MAG: hypothetical protein JW913_12665 [Chitinispirillaceae bacterium]|nr:hypothetical protein [Chitinispirillaceae bacterium]
MKTQFQLHYGRSPDLWPVMVGMKNDLTNIFSVPVDNAVGTNSINNAITLLRFNGDQIEYDEVRKDFINGVGCGDKYYPGIFSDRWIGYTQTRGFLLFNLKDKSFSDNIIIGPSYEWITDAAFTGGGPLQFMFQVCRSDEKRFLRIFDFEENGKFHLHSELQAGPHKVGYIEPWAVQNKTVFIYNNDSIRITAYDMNFKPVQHPFCEVFNTIKSFRRLDQLVLHPHLPIAVCVEITREGRGAYKAWLINWKHTDHEKRVIELLGQDISMFSEWRELKGLKCSGFQFSPDGKWLVFRDDSEMVLQSIENPTFVAMPVDGARQMPLGRPKVLGRVMREHAQPTSTAWIAKPLSFVVSDGLVLYKWELEGLPREFGE